MSQELLPSIAIDVNGFSYRINKEDLGYADIGNGFTYGGIQSRGDLPFDILGDTFLKNVYAIFDVVSLRSSRVRFARMLKST